MARVRRLHPGADEELLRALPGGIRCAAAGAREPGRSPTSKSSIRRFRTRCSSARNERCWPTISTRNSTACFAAHVAPPAAVRARNRGEHARVDQRARLNDVFRRRRVPRTGAQHARGGIHPARRSAASSITATTTACAAICTRWLSGAIPSQPKVLAYTAERIRAARRRDCEFTAITETEPSPDNPRHQFIARLFADENIAIVPLASHREVRRRTSPAPPVDANSDPQAPSREPAPAAPGKSRRPRRISAAHAPR